MNLTIPIQALGRGGFWPLRCWARPCRPWRWRARTASSLFQPDSSQQVTAYAPDERVRIVIELEDAPLLDSHKVSQYAA